MAEFRRQLDWIPKTLESFRSATPTPGNYFEILSPTIDSFGTVRMADVEHASISNLAGQLELTHDQVPQNRWRLYLSIEYWHNDAVNREIAPARIVETTGAFPIARFRDEISVGGDFRLAARQISVGPGNRIAVETRAIGAGARLFASLVWIEMPLGEYVNSTFG